MKKTVFLSALQIAALITFGQTGSYELPKIIPASPTAQTLMRYGEIPVDNSTGVPSIEIPIYTVEGRQLKVPISISYHASGIKVNDIASEVGLGWALNCGGMVSRSINDRRDEETGYQRTYNNAGALLTALNAAADEGYDQSAGCLNGIRNFEHYLTQNFSYSEDPMKDRYFYKLPTGLSGVFTYNYVNDNNIIMLPRRPLKIEKYVEWDGSWHRIRSFKITDDNGTVYTFQTYIANPTQNYSDWFLKEMVSADGTEKITFNYTLQTANPSTPGILSQTYQGWAENISRNCGPPNRESSLSTTVSPLPQFSTPVLDAIVSSKAFVKFEYASRDDFNYLKRLTKITIAPVNSPTDIVKTIQFDHKYFGSTVEDRRLGLNSVVITAPTNLHPQQYSFTYENQILPPYPFKMTYPSYNEDFWGYYNGSNSPSLIPRDFISNSYDQQTSGGRREADSYYYSKACLLKEIKYPTGGRTVFEFERCYSSAAYPYKAEPYERGGYIGGFRVARITNYTDNSKVANVNTYEYELPVTTKIGMDYFRYDHSFIEKRNNPGGPGIPDTWCWAIYSRKIVSSNPVLPLEVAPGLPIMYQKVTEYNGTLTNHAGKTVYTYAQPYSPSDYFNNPEHPLEFEAPRFYHPYHYDRGNYVPELVSKTVNSFDGTNYHPISKEEYVYSPLFATTYNTGIKLTRLKQFPNLDYWCFPCYNGPTFCSIIIIPLIAEYKASTVAIDSKAYQEASLLTNSKVYTYDPLDETKYLLVSMDYSYNESNLAIKEKSTLSSKSDLIKWTYKHPMDYPGTAVYDSMVSRNIISPVIEQTTSKNNSFLQSQKTNYDYWNGNAWSTLATNMIVPRTVDGTTLSSIETRIEYGSYDETGNVRTVSKKDDVKTTYLWGYNKTYPVAHVVGADYATISAFVNQAVLDNPQSDEQLRNELNNLRNRLASSNIKALVTSYSYRPLVGMTSQTDPNGRTTYYDYDTFGRLKLIRDKDNKILKTFNYQYQQNP